MRGSGSQYCDFGSNITRWLESPDFTILGRCTMLPSAATRVSPSSSMTGTGLVFICCCRKEPNGASLVNIAAIAWNASLIPTSERKEIIENSLKTASKEIRSDMQMILNEMIERKGMHFAHHKRMILNYKAMMTKEGNPHITVLSTHVSDDVDG